MTLVLHPRQELLSYIPKPLQWQVDTANIKSSVKQELRQMQGYSKQQAQIGFIGGSASRAIKGLLPMRVKTQEGRGEDGKETRSLSRMAKWGRSQRSAAETIALSSTRREHSAAAPLWLHCVRSAESE